jgi:hypothetical protein
VVICAASAPSAVKPGLAVRRCRNERIISVAPTSSTTASASSPDDQRAVQPCAARARGGAAPAVAQGGLQVAAGGAQRGRQPEEHRRPHETREDEEEHVAVDVEHHPQRRLEGEGGQDQPQPAHGERDPQRAAQQAHQHSSR